MELDYLNAGSRRTPWNKDKIIGQKAPLKLKEIWALPPAGKWAAEGTRFVQSRD